MEAEKVRKAVEIRETRENKEATRRYVGLRLAGRGRIGIFRDTRQAGWLMPISDSFGLRYTEDARKDVGNLEWGGVVGSDSGPVQEWTRSEWEAGGMGAYIAALSMLADVVPLSVAWGAVWRFTREVVLELPRTEAEIRSREARRGFDLGSLTTPGDDPQQPQQPQQAKQVNNETSGDSSGITTLSGGHEVQWEITRDEIFQWVYPQVGADHSDQAK